MQTSRRAFIRGHWNPGYPAQNAAKHDTVEIVSLIVNAWPQHLDEVADAILTLGGTEIHGRDPKGKLIVVMEDQTQGAIGAKTNLIAGFPHVLSAVMAFQATDTDEPLA
jgi:periplasmic nitrate reductase NapD